MTTSPNDLHFHLMGWDDEVADEEDEDDDEEVRDPEHAINSRS
jgi:hypothetical protein